MTDSVPNQKNKPTEVATSGIPTGTAAVTKLQTKEDPKARAAWEQRWPSLDFSHPEFFFRTGVIICAAIFLIEATGWPFTESIMIVVASLILATLFTLTMAFQWRVMGDWRRTANQSLLVLFLVTLIIPFTAIMTPSLENFPIPENAQNFLENAVTDLTRIPGITEMFSIAKGIIVFVFFLISMLVLVFNLDSTRRAGLTILGVLYSILLLILYPTVETIVGLLFLVFFLRLQWEMPLMIPPKLLPHLKVVQLEYLRELVDEGSLSTGETKIYLNQDPALFAELLEFQLVEVDTIARDIIPGKRLLCDTSTETMEKFASYTRRTMWIMAGIIYFLMPDLIPFYFDDAIILLIASGAGFGWVKTLFGEKRQQQKRGRR